MPFRIAARTILELGAELISSDAVAIYELIKNALDAGSRSVTVSVQVVVRRTAYQNALDALAARTPTRLVLSELASETLAGAPARARDRFLEGVGAAVGDRVEFRRVLKRLYRSENWIRVKDTGHGMSMAGLTDDFLTIGTRSRRRRKVSRLGRHLEAGAGLLGDKGVGRLSAMRLGDHLSVVTTTAGEAHWNRLDVDWNRFSHASDALLEDVDVRPERGAPKSDPTVAGTRITVSALRGDWDVAVFRAMVRGQFGRIVDPLPPEPDQPVARAKPDPDQLFAFAFNGEAQDLEGVPAWLLRQAHAHVSARYDFDDDGRPVLSGTIDYRLRNKSRTFRLVEAELLSLTDPIADRAVRSTPRVLRDLGPFDVSFYWYNRRILTEVKLDARTLKRNDVVAAVAEWSGGLMVHRDGFRINPYGSGDDDWLELDRKALGARGYKVNRAQIVGRVALTSRNHRLVEQTNREGLADNEYKQALVGMLRHILITEFRTFIGRVDEDRRVRELTTTEDLDARIARTRDQAERTVIELMRAVPAERERLNGLRGLVQEIGHLMDQARRLGEELEDDKAKFRQLAGIGLMVEFVLHEIGRTTGRALDAVTGIDRDRLAASDVGALRTLEDQLLTLRKRVDNLDPLSTSRRQVKEDLDVAEIVRQVVAGRSAQFQRHGIEVSVDDEGTRWRVRAVRGMMIGILENLIENAVYWLSMEAHANRRFRPRIEVGLDHSSGEISVTDNGPGVDASRAEEIFEPFVTAKPPGQGRGLGLYIARDMAASNGWTLAMSPEEGARAGRLNTFVLDLDPRT